jgi:phosphatidylserine decarboxylase
MLLLAPADGKVVQIETVHESLYIQGEARQVSIFLSPLDVHVNRVPADGVIEYDQYVPGDYLVAWHPKASEKNERSQLGLRHPSGTPILFKQIAGAVARRIVYHIGVGDKVRAGERFGLVKFGSRMDVLVPPYVPIHVKVGDRVVAGETVLGDLSAPLPVGATEAPAAHADRE